MSDIFKPVPWTVQQLVDGVSTGVLRLPDLQRPFVWPATKVRDLMDSMYRGYPVGELMFWKVRDDDASSGIGPDTKTQSGSHQIVDGQQRLTSLYATITGRDVIDDEYRTKKITIAFNPFTSRFEVSTPVYERSPEWIADIATVFKSPLRAHTGFVKHYESSRPNPLTQDEADELLQIFINLDNLKTYSFTVVELQDNADKAVVADIFVRINSEGVNLTASDFILTWLSVFWPEGREQLEDFARDSRITAERASEITGRKVSWTPKNQHIAVSPGQLIRVAVAVGQGRGRLQDAYSALRGRDRQTGQPDSSKQLVELDKIKTGVPIILNRLHWDEFLRVPTKAGFRSRKMVTSDNTLLYSYSLWLLGRTRYKVGLSDLRDLIARWFFMAQTTGRYTNSPETRIQQDLDRFDGLDHGDAQGFVATLDAVIATVFTPDFWTISMPDDFVTSSTAASPAYQAYLAALNILDAELFMLQSRIYDWMDPTATSVKNVEGHHLFPREHLRQHLGYKDIKKINQVANFAPTDWDTNIFISDRAPSDYWPELLRARGFSGQALSHQKFWHALPDGWETMAYDDFLSARRKLMALVTREGFRRLSDPAYQPTITRDPVVETTKQHLSILDLMTAGVLSAGDIISTVDPEFDRLAEITEDGEIMLGDHLYDSPSRAANAAGGDHSDGWDFWQLERENETKSLADLAETLTVLAPPALTS